jgi:hypothetical protein
MKFLFDLFTARSARPRKLGDRIIIVRMPLSRRAGEGPGEGRPQRPTKSAYPRSKNAGYKTCAFAPAGRFPGHGTWYKNFIGSLRERAGLGKAKHCFVFFLFPTSPCIPRTGAARGYAECRMQVNKPFSQAVRPRLAVSGEGKAAFVRQA